MCFHLFIYSLRPYISDTLPLLLPLHIDNTIIDLQICKHIRHLWLTRDIGGGGHTGDARSFVLNVFRYKLSSFFPVICHCIAFSMQPRPTPSQQQQPLLKSIFRNYKTKQMKRAIIATLMYFPLSHSHHRFHTRWFTAIDTVTQCISSKKSLECISSAAMSQRERQTPNKKRMRRRLLAKRSERKR